MKHNRRNGDRQRSLLSQSDLSAFVNKRSEKNYNANIEPIITDKFYGKGREDSTNVECLSPLK